MTIRDFVFRDNNWAFDTIKIRTYSPNTAPCTVLEETIVGNIHPGWYKFEVYSFSLSQHKNDDSVCIIAYIKEGDEDFEW